MNTINKLKLVLCITLAGVLSTQMACKKDKSDSAATARQKVLDDYNQNYLGSAVTNVGWTGSTTTCTPGTVGADVDAKVLQRINYFRRQVGLNDNITLDVVKNQKCMQAALMMQANNALNHTPPNTWKCYTADGASAAGVSNLGLGYNSTNALSGMMQDGGSGNTACGHRRWILFSRALTMGHGSTTGSMALWVIGGASPTPPAGMPEFISWPPKGFVVATLVYPRWSFSIPSADFSAATVSMTDNNGNTLSCNIVSTVSGYGDNSIIWEPTGVITNSSSDQKYTVTLSNVKIGADTKTFKYEVTVIKS